jgi:hypothetical protein
MPPKALFKIKPFSNHLYDFGRILWFRTFQQKTIVLTNKTVCSRVQAMEVETYHYSRAMRQSLAYYKLRILDTADGYTGLHNTYSSIHTRKSSWGHQAKRKKPKPEEQEGVPHRQHLGTLLKNVASSYHISLPISGKRYQQVGWCDKMIIPDYKNDLHQVQQIFNSRLCSMRHMRHVTIPCNRASVLTVNVLVYARGIGNPKDVPYEA